MTNKTNDSNKNFRRLFLDIETSMCMGWFWRAGFNQNIGHHQILEDSKVICVSYLWEGEDKSKVKTIKWNMSKQCDRLLLVKFSKVLSQADSIVGQNSESFDMKIVQKRIAYHGLAPLGQLSTDDTMKQAKKHFKMDSNSLAYMCKYFGLQLKTDPGGYNTWLDIQLRKDKEALKRMVTYCENDVIVTAKLWAKMLPYINPKQAVKPNRIGQEQKCNSCGSEEVIKYGNYRTRAGIYQKFRCNSCGSITKSSTRKD